MAEQLDEKLQVKLMCAGIIVCAVISIALLMSIFLNQMLIEKENTDLDDITILATYVAISMFSIVMIACAYRIEKGSKTAWKICIILESIALISEILTFAPVISSFLSLALSIIVITLLMTRTLRGNCGIEFKKKGTAEGS